MSSFSRSTAVVEPLIGHLKNEGHLGRNYLKGEQGDRLNALLAAAGYNFRLLLKLLRRFFAFNLGETINPTSATLFASRSEIIPR